MHIELPDGNAAELIAKEAVTQRINRPIEYARSKIFNLSLRWLDEGYDPPENWVVLDESAPDYEEKSKEREARFKKNLLITTNISPDDQKAMDDYQMALVLGMVQSWSYGAVTEDAALDLPTETFEFLAQACQSEYEETKVSVGPDPDPKATTDASEPLNAP